MRVHVGEAHDPRDDCRLGVARARGHNGAGGTGPRSVHLRSLGGEAARLGDERLRGALLREEGGAVARARGVRSTG